MPTETFTHYDAKGNLIGTETAEMLASQANRQTLVDQATQATANNRTYIALASPTAAQTTAQTKALSRQNNAIIRLLLNQLDATD